MSRNQNRQGRSSWTRTLGDLLDGERVALVVTCAGNTLLQIGARATTAKLACTDTSTASRDHWMDATGVFTRWADGRASYDESLCEVPAPQGGQGRLPAAEGRVADGRRPPVVDAKRRCVGAGRRARPRLTSASQLNSGSPARRDPARRRGTPPARPILTG